MKLSALLLVLVSPTVSWAQSRTPLVQSVDIDVPTPAVAVRIAGTSHLVYELHVTNFRPFDVALTRVEVLDDASKARLADLRDSALANRLGRPGSQPRMADSRVIGAGMRAIVYLWLALDKTATAPRTLAHRLELELIRPTGREAAVVEGGAIEVRQQRPLVLGAPLRGGPWVAVYDPALVGGHRTSIYTIEGRARIPGRFAIDWVRLDAEGSPTRGDRSSLTNWLGYQAEVLAVADAVVVEAKDDIAADTPISDTLAAPLPLENASGNYVTLRLGEGHYAFYEHLKPGSIRVRAGDRVKRGQVLGLLGNSGSSSAGPHLHFHVSDAGSDLAAEGMPYAFRQFQVLGAYESVGAAMGGGRWGPAPRDAGGMRTMELPAANAVILFEGDDPARPRP